MQRLVFLSLFAIGVSALDTTEGQDDPHFKYTEYIFDTSKYVSPSFATRRIRVTRDNAGIGVPLLADVVKTCENNTELQDSLAHMVTCVKSKPIVVTPKDEFIQNLENCGLKTRQLLKDCMPEKLKYIIEVIFPLAVSTSKLVYDDSKEVAKLASCLPDLSSSKSGKYYKDCVANTSTSEKIPGSKKIFCEQFVEVSECYVKQINNTCTIDSDIEKYTKDYMTAIKEPCLDELE